MQIFTLFVMVPIVLQVLPASSFVSMCPWYLLTPVDAVVLGQVWLQASPCKRGEGSLVWACCAVVVPLSLLSVSTSLFNTSHLLCTSLVPVAVRLPGSYHQETVASLKGGSVNSSRNKVYCDIIFTYSCFM